MKQLKINDMLKKRVRDTNINGTLPKFDVTMPLEIPNELKSIDDGAIAFPSENNFLPVEPAPAEAIVDPKFVEFTKKIAHLDIKSNQTIDLLKTVELGFRSTAVPKQDALIDEVINKELFKRFFEENRRSLPLLGCSLLCHFCSDLGSTRIRGSLANGPICNCGCPLCSQVIERTDNLFATQIFKDSSIRYTKKRLIRLGEDRISVIKCNNYLDLRALSYSLAKSVHINDAFDVQFFTVPKVDRIPAETFAKDKELTLVEFD